MSSMEYVMTIFKFSLWKQIINILFSLYFHRQIDRISMEDLHTEDVTTGKQMYKMIDW